MAKTKAPAIRRGFRFYGPDWKGYGRVLMQALARFDHSYW
jgi:hypothetical protein